MASAKPKGGLTKWFKEEWVNIGKKKKGGGYAPCGRKKASTKKKGYPKCVPKAKAAKMTAAQKRVRTYAKKKRKTNKKNNR